jgi:hypothetical protein
VCAGLSPAPGGESRWGTPRKPVTKPLTPLSAIAKREVIGALVAESCLREGEGGGEGGSGANSACVVVALGVEGGAYDSGGWALLMSLARLVLTRTEAELDAVANSISMHLQRDQRAAFGNFVVGALSQENERDAQVFMTQFSANVLAFFLISTKVQILTPEELLGRSGCVTLSSALKFSTNLLALLVQKYKY